MLPVRVTDQPTRSGPTKPPRFPTALIKPRAPPENPGGKSNAGMAQKGLCMAFKKNPVNTSKAKANHAQRVNQVASNRVSAKPANETDVQRRRLRHLSDKAPKTYNPPNATRNGREDNQPTFPKLIRVSPESRVGSQIE